MDEHMEVFSNKQFKCNWWMHGHSSNWWKLDLFTTCKTGVVTCLLNLSREPVRNDCGAVQCGEADWCWCGGLHCSHGWPGAWKSNSSCAGVCFAPQFMWCVQCHLLPTCWSGCGFLKWKYPSASWTRVEYLESCAGEWWSVFLKEGCFVSQIVNYYQEKSSLWMVAAGMSGLQVVSVSSCQRVSVRPGKEWDAVLHFSNPDYWSFCAEVHHKVVWGLLDLCSHKTHESTKWNLVDESNKQQHG